MVSFLKIFTLAFICILRATDAIEDKDPDAIPSWIASVNPAKMTEKEREGILWEEKRQRKRLLQIGKSIEAGEKTKLSKLPALHDLGRVLYKLERFEDALEIGREVVGIYTEEYGEWDRRTLSAVTNVASTLHRLQRAEECHALMTSMFPTLLSRYGVGSKEVSFHIGKMRVFHIPEAEIGAMVSDHQQKRDRASVSPDGYIQPSGE